VSAFISHDPDLREARHSIESFREGIPATQVCISGGLPPAHASASGRSTLTPSPVKVIGLNSHHSWRARLITRALSQGLNPSLDFNRHSEASPTRRTDCQAQIPKEQTLGLITGSGTNCVSIPVTPVGFLQRATQIFGRAGSCIASFFQRGDPNETIDPFDLLALVGKPNSSPELGSSAESSGHG
jgi:hypothetical protein